MNLWSDFYGNNGEFGRLYDRIKAIRQRHWDRVILPHWSRNVPAEAWRRHNRLCHRTDRALRNAEHRLHERMNETGRYLWCDACQGRPHHCFYEAGFSPA